MVKIRVRNHEKNRARNRARKKSCTISRFVHDKIFSCTIFFVHDKCSIVHDFLGSKDFLEYFFVVFFSKTLRLKTTEMIFLKIINKKEVLSLLVEKKEWIGVFRDQKYQKIVHDNFFGLARFCTIFIYRTIFFVHDFVHDRAR